MLAFAVRRFLTGLVQVALVSMVTFVVLRLLPEDPASVFAGPTADIESRTIVSQQLGLDRSIGDQLVSFLWDAAHGSLGTR